MDEWMIEFNITFTEVLTEQGKYDIKWNKGGVWTHKFCNNIHKRICAQLLCDKRIRFFDLVMTLTQK